MTRESDVTTELYSRAYLANDLGVDLFVSIHCNSLADRSVQGTMVYYYKTTDDSNRLATSIYNALIADAGRPAKGVRTDSLAVVRETTMPSVLAECAFISNPTEESLLATPEFRQQLAQGIYDGIAAYQATNSD
jgi:N-acetylmuramoyl-L-alanine amidase